MGCLKTNYQTNNNIQIKHKTALQLGTCIVKYVKFHISYLLFFTI